MRSTGSAADTAKAEAVKPRNSAYKIAYHYNVTDKNRAKFGEHIDKYIELQAVAQKIGEQVYQASQESSGEEAKDAEFSEKAEETPEEKDEKKKD